MTLNDYQKEAFKTAIYPHKGSGAPMSIAYAALGLGEAGEVQNKVKKILRGDKPVQLAREGIAFELGGLLWYIAALAKELGYDLEEIAQMNLDSLKGRMERGVIKGDGDER
jgi:NTP pyrophosphatase (non-canonical NTP hydrolase)